jgi:hypothetical protein
MFCRHISSDVLYTVRVAGSYDSAGPRLLTHNGLIQEAPKDWAGSLRERHRQQSHGRETEPFPHYVRMLAAMEALNSTVKRGRNGLVTITTSPGIYLDSKIVNWSLTESVIRTLPWGPVDSFTTRSR